MKIKNIDIENFRAIEKAIIDCVGYNSFVGPNGSGKSTVLDALNIFFGERNLFKEDDFHKSDVGKIISIKITFNELNDAAKETFKHYVRNDELVITSIISCDENGKFSKRVHGERLVFSAFQSFFEKTTAAEAKAVFDELRIEYPKLKNATTKDGRANSLQAYEETLSDEEKSLEPSGDEFFGATKGIDRIRKHVHWVYIPAVKDASGESEEGKTSYLGKLIQHTVKSGMDYEEKLKKIRDDAFGAYEELLDSEQEHLEALRARLSERLQYNVTSDADLGLVWRKDEKSVSVDEPVAKVSLKDKGFSGEVDSFGHGLQRSFLIVILQELVSSDAENSPTLILGCEEPELYQHPPQAKHLASILMEMSSGDTQIFCSTHSPYFIDVEHYDGIKMFRNDGSGALITSSKFAEILEEYNAAFNKPLQNDAQIKTKLSLQMLPKYNELFFSDKVVLVEGISDQACLEAFLRLSGRKQEFQRSGSSIIVCEGKSSLVMMLIIAKKFRIPFHVVFDCDSDCDEQNKNEHLRDNNALLSISGHDVIQNFPMDNLTYPNLTAWLNAIEGMLHNELGDDKDGVLETARNATGQLKSCTKYPLFVAHVMSEGWSKGKTFPLLNDLVDRVLAS